MPGMLRRKAEHRMLIEDINFLDYQVDATVVLHEQVRGSRKRCRGDAARETSAPASARPRLVHSIARTPTRPHTPGRDIECCIAITGTRRAPWCTQLQARKRRDDVRGAKGASRQLRLH